MASEMVNPIDWPLPPTLYRAVPPSPTCTVQIRAAFARNLTPNRPNACEATVNSYATTQDIRPLQYKSK